MIRNIVGVLSGLLVSVCLIMLAVTADKHWFDELSVVTLENKTDVFVYWQSVINQAPNEFFIALVIAFGLASCIGGMVTAAIVKRAKTAYAIFIGFLLFLVAVGDIIIHVNHQTWYEISVYFVFFPFAWLGGKIIERMQEIETI